MNDELKPCPKCGSESLELDSSSSLSLSWVICNDCEFKLQKKVPEENIWRHWNKIKPDSKACPSPYNSSPPAIPGDE